MARRDIEMTLYAIVGLYQEKLGAKLAALSAEKDDGMVLKVPPIEAYFVQELNGKMVNYNPFLMVSLEGIDTTAYGPNTTDLLSIHVSICLADEGQDLAIGRRMFRYHRALKEVLEENWDRAELGGKMQIGSLAPISFRLLDSSRIHRAVGIEIRTAIG